MILSDKEYTLFKNAISEYKIFVKNDCRNQTNSTKDKQTIVDISYMNKNPKSTTISDYTTKCFAGNRAKINSTKTEKGSVIDIKV